MNRFLTLALAWLLLSAPAFAGSGTITVLDSTSTTKTYDVITDGSGNFVSKMGVCDGTAAANCAAVKAASTAALATDPSIVVQESPNSGILAALQAGTGTIGTGPAPTSANQIGGTGSSAEPTKVTTGQLVAGFYDLVGKTITSPYSNRENQIRGGGNATGTGAFNILPASGSASLKEYMTDVECGRTDAGATPIIVTFNDSVPTVLVIPPLGGNSKAFATPLVGSANTAVTATFGTGVTTGYCYAQGFVGY